MRRGRRRESAGVRLWLTTQDLRAWRNWQTPGTLMYSIHVNMDTAMQ